MKNLLVFFGFFGCSLLFTTAQISVADSRLDLIVVQNLTNYLRTTKLNSNLTPLEKFDLNRAQIRYTIGRRVNGDRVVATNAANQQWATAQNVALTLAYPQSGVGNVVTFVDILVDQSSSLGQAYIVGGGIGQRRITVVVEAYNTTRFQYTATIYGY